MKLRETQNRGGQPNFCTTEEKSPSPRKPARKGRIREGNARRRSAPTLPIKMPRHPNQRGGIRAAYDVDESPTIGEEGKRPFVQARCAGKKGEERRERSQPALDLAPKTPRQVQHQQGRNAKRVPPQRTVYKGEEKRGYIKWVQLPL